MTIYDKAQNNHLNTQTHTLSKQHMAPGERLKSAIPKLEEVTKSAESESTEVPNKSFLKRQKDQFLQFTY